MDTEENATSSPWLAKNTNRALLAGLALLAVLAVVLLAPLPQLNRVGRTVLDLGHAPAFAVVTIALFWVITAALPDASWRILAGLGIMMIGFGCASEILQSVTGRTFTLQDAMANALGVLAGVCWLGQRYVDNRGGRVALVAAGLLALTLASRNPVMAFVDIVRQKTEMPILSSLENSAELTRWQPCEGKMSRTKTGVTHGEWALRVDLKAGEYPCVTLNWPVSDWTEYETLAFDITVPEPSSNDRSVDGTENAETADASGIKLILKIEDSQHNGEYEDRFHRTLELPPGRHEIRVPLSEVATAPQSRMMRMDDIYRVQLFANHPRRPQTFYLDHVRLE